MEVHLVFINKDGTTQPFKLPSAVTFIGRRRDCDMCIPLSVVSRRHCEIYTEFDKLMVRDLKSRNGTFVNDESIDEASLKAGDVLTIGPLKFVVQIDGAPNNFDEFLPPSFERQAEPEPKMSAEDETTEADFERVMEDISSDNAGQSQTMDIDNIFTNDFPEEDDFDLGANPA
jgi:pSer/pThr/pTyr-binding forkhead associated (FHA) protein